MSKLIIDRNIGTRPTWTEELRITNQAYYKQQATPEQKELLRQYNDALNEYERKERILKKKPCPDCDSTQTYCKAKGTILVCRKCNAESPIEYLN